MSSGIKVSALPGVSNLNRPYWEGLREHKIRMQHCNSCGNTWYVPGPWCPQCLSRDFSWQEMSGKGHVRNFVDFVGGNHATMLGGSKEGLPKNAVEVELDEGPRLISNVLDVEHGELQIGTRVTAVFEDAMEGLTLLRFKPE